jgi:hypothetical protein
LLHSIRRFVCCAVLLAVLTVLIPTSVARADDQDYTAYWQQQTGQTYQQDYTAYWQNVQAQQQAPQ